MRGRVRLWVALAMVLPLSAPSWAAETVTYTYNARGRLVQVTRGGGPQSGAQVTYTHDAAGNRVQVVVTGAP